MALLNNLVDALASRAGWKRPRQDEDGAYRFRLENGLDFAVFSPDGRAAVLRAKFADVPASGPDREEMLRAAAGRQAGVCRIRGSGKAGAESAEVRLRFRRQACPVPHGGTCRRAGGV